MERAWSAKCGRLAVAGTFGDVDLHHHPVVQIGIALGDSMSLYTPGARLESRLVVIASGVRHALRTGDSPALSVYLRADSATGARLNELCRARGGPDRVWAVDPDEAFSAQIAETYAADGIDAAVDTALAWLLPERHSAADSVHPQLRQAVDLLETRIPRAADLDSVARAVALSPDYLGRLFRRQTGTTFSTTVRWLRLISAFRHLTDGASVTDAAHLAGFTDGPHASRTCRELTGATPRDFTRAVQH